MNTTEAQRKEMRAQLAGLPGRGRRTIGIVELLDEIDMLRAALRRIAEAHKSANGPCMTADDACPCAQCEAGRIGE